MEFSCMPLEGPWLYQLCMNRLCVLPYLFSGCCAGFGQQPELVLPASSGQISCLLQFWSQNWFWAAARTGSACQFWTELLIATVLVPELVLGSSQNWFCLPVLDRTADCFCSGARTGSGRLALPELAALVYRNSGLHSPLLGMRVGDRLVVVIWIEVSLVGV